MNEKITYGILGAVILFLVMFGIGTVYVIGQETVWKAAERRGLAEQRWVEGHQRWFWHDEK